MECFAMIDWQAGFSDGRFFWIEWHFWKVVGWLGTLVFFSRFIIQWVATEKKKRVVVPSAFWWLSLVGTLLLLSYAISRRDSVFIASNCVAWVPYVRNLIIHRRHKKAHTDCPACANVCAPESNFCSACGAKLTEDMASAA